MTDEIRDYHPIDKRDPKTGRLGPRALVVDPHGLIRSIVVGLAPERGNGKGSIVNQVRDQRNNLVLEVDPFYRDQGWVFLADAYKADPNEQRQRDGLTVYERWNNAGRLGKVEKLNDGWLPAIVRERRAKAAELRAKGIVRLPAAPIDDDTGRKRPRNRTQASAQPDASVRDDG